MLLSIIYPSLHTQGPPHSRVHTRFLDLQVSGQAVGHPVSVPFTVQSGSEKDKPKEPKIKQRKSPNFIFMITVLLPQKYLQYNGRFVFIY